MQVALRGGDVRVAHGRPHAREVDAAGDEERAVGVPQVVEAQRFEAGSISGTLEAASQR